VGAAKGVISGREETRETGGVSGMGNEGLGVRGKVAVGVGVERRAGVVCG
jgi:hypothetical protein